jgi:hypothetical protein
MFRHQVHEGDGAISGRRAGHGTPLVSRRNKLRVPDPRRRTDPICPRTVGVVRAEGLEPSRAEAQRIFLPSTAFVARTQRFEARASGLRSGLSLHRSPEKPRLRCCPSSLYTFLVGLLHAATKSSIPPRLGSGLPLQVSPNLGSSASPVSQPSTQVSLSP